MTSSTPPHLQQTRATRATPPQGPIIVQQQRTGLLVTLAVLLLVTAAAAAWFGTRALKLQRELAQQNVLLERSVSRLSEQDKLVSTLMDADGELAVAQAVNGSTQGVTLYWNRRDGSTVLSAFGLPALPPGRVYALWMVDNTRPRLATTFTTDSKGRALTTNFVIPRGRTDVPRLMVTVEQSTPGMVPNMPALVGGTDGAVGTDSVPVVR